MGQKKDLAALQVQLELQSAAFNRGMDRAVKQINRMDGRAKKTTRTMQAMDRTMKSMARTAKTFGVGILAAFSVGSVKKAVEFGDAIAKTASAVGLSVEQFQEYGHAAEIAGVASSQFNSNMIAFVKRVGEARAGMGPLVSGLKNLNPALLESLKSSESQGEAFQILVKAMDEASTATEKAAIANAAFSRAGVTMANLTTEGLTAGAEAARDLGIVMDETTTKKAEFLQDRITEMTNVIKVEFSSALITAGAAVSDLFGVYSDTSGLEEAIAKVEKRLADFKAQATELNDVIENGWWLKRGGASKRLEEVNVFIQQAEDRLAELNGQLEAFNTTGKDAADTTVGLSDGLEEIAVSARKFNAGFDPGPIEAMAEYAKNAAAPLRQLGINLENLEAAYNVGLISAAQFNAAMEQLVDQELQPIEIEVRTSDAILKVEQFADNTSGLLKDIKTAADGFISDFTNTLVDGLVTGEMRFKEFAESMLSTIAKLMLNKVFEQFFNMMLQSWGTQSGVNNLLNQPGMFASPVPAGGGPATLAAGPQKMNVGVMTAPTYGYSGRRSGSNVTMNIHNNAPVEIQTRERQNSRGGLDIDVFVEQKMAQAIAGGGLDRSLNSAYGINRRAF